MQSFAFAQQLTIRAENELSFGRLNQTIELSSDQLKPLGKVSLNSIHIKDGSGREIICQAIDTDGDYRPDKVIFQADFAPEQTRYFYVYEGERHLYQPEQYKAYGRFNRERFDDFAWENDRIAQRTYGPALKKPAGGALTSSTIDVWAKKTPRLIINDWYMTAHYHTNTGEGADLYKSGNTRGLGSDGLWTGDRLWVPENFTQSRVLSSGPIRVSFKLTHDIFDFRGNDIKEIKNITLDAGQNLNHFKVTYEAGKLRDVLAAAGIQTSKFSAEEIRKGLKPYHNTVPIERHPGAFTQKEVNKQEGWLITEQPVSEGKLYAAIIVKPEDFVKVIRDNNNELVLTQLPKNNTFSYWAGFSWSRSNQFDSFEEWKTYIDHFAKALRSPIKISVTQ